MRYHFETVSGIQPRGFGPHSPVFKPIRVGSRLDLRLGGREIARCDLVGEATDFVAAVAEGFVGGMAAAAESERSAAGEAERLAFRINDFEVAFDPKRTVVIDRDLRCRHVSPEF